MKVADQIKALDIACEIELYGEAHYEREKRGCWEVKLRWSRKGTELRIIEHSSDLELTMQNALSRMLAIANEGLPSKGTALQRPIKAKALGKASDDEVPF